ncbi:MAG: cytidine deaminase [Sneathiella sp.]
MSDTTKKLRDLANDIMEKSYSPYSNFSVGASLITEKGNIYSGCNVENVSYGLAICAERNAIVQAVAKEGPGVKINKIVITNKNSEGNSIPCSPCGACRQFIAEFATAQTSIHYQGTKGDVTLTMEELLPDSFRF